MQKTITLTLCGLMLASTAALADGPRFNPRNAQFKPLPRGVTPQLNNKLIVKKPDLAVTQFSVRVMEKVSRWQFRVRLTATVKNVGQGDYISGANQQSMTIMPVGASRASKTLRFQNLRVGQSASISHDFTFSLSDEFPTNWVARVGFDPDIYIDGNRRNDDTNRANNARTITASKIRAVVSRPVLSGKVPLKKPLLKHKLNLRPISR